MKNRIYILLSILTLVFACKTDNTVNPVTYPTFKPTIAVSQSVSPIPSVIPTPSPTPCIFPAVTPTPQRSSWMPPLPVTEGTKANAITSLGGFGIMAISDKGEFVIAWTVGIKGTDNSKEIYARVFNSNGISTTCQEFKVAEFSSNYQVFFYPVGANFDENGNITIAYYNNKEIYIKKFSQNGDVIGSELKVTEMSNFYDFDYSIDGSFVISSIEYKQTGGMPQVEKIHVKKFGNNLKEIGNEYSTEIEGKRMGIYKPTVKFDSNGNYFVIWNDKSNLFISKINSDGSIKYNKVKIASDVDSQYLEFSENSDHDMIIDKNNNLIISYFGGLRVLVLSNNLEIIKPELNIIPEGFRVRAPTNSLMTDKDNNLFVLYNAYDPKTLIGGITLRIFDEKLSPLNNGKIIYSDPSLNLQRESIVYNEKTGFVILSENLYFRRFDSFGNEIK